MDKKSNLYTKTGDTGKTSLVGGQRVDKFDLRLECYGTVDELNSFIGLLMAFDLEDKDHEMLTWLQHKLFTIGSYLATDVNETQIKVESRVFDSTIERIEKEIDRLDSLVPKMKAFILPSGGKSVATAHICRTVCRRAERLIYKLNTQTPLEPRVLKFINRLSDYLFAVARKETFRINGREIEWEYTAD